jgi:hypothetical protein
MTMTDEALIVVKELDTLIVRKAIGELANFGGQCFENKCEWVCCTSSSS